MHKNVLQCTFSKNKAIVHFQYSIFQYSFEVIPFVYVLAQRSNTEIMHLNIYLDHQVRVSDAGSSVVKFCYAVSFFSSDISSWFLFWFIYKVLHSTYQVLLLLFCFVFCKTSIQLPKGQVVLQVSHNRSSSRQADPTHFVL